MTSLEINDLPMQEKLVLMEQLWDSIIHEQIEMPSPAWHQAVVTDRLKRLAIGEEKIYSLQQAKARLNK